MSTNHTRINWATRLARIIAANSSIPPDVAFKIMEAGTAHYVNAHKMILAMVSPVFEDMFYTHNTASKSAKEIEIPDTTKPAFEIMISAIYDAMLIEDSLKGKSVNEVFNVLYLVTKYQIPELIRAVEAYLSSFPLTDNTVVEVASEAIEFRETFHKQAQDLLLLCAKFLKTKLTDVPSLLRFVVENKDELATVNELQIIMHSLTPSTALLAQTATKFPASFSKGKKCYYSVFD